MSDNKSGIKGLLERLSKRFGRFSGSGKGAENKHDAGLLGLEDDMGFVVLGGDGEDLPPQVRQALGRMLSLSGSFPQPKIFDDGYILEGLGLPCPAMKPHDHISIRLNASFTKPLMPEDGDERVKIFKDRSEIEGYLDEVMRSGDIDKLADVSADGMAAPGMMQMSANIPMLQLEDGRFMLIKDKRQRQAIEDEMAGTPALHAKTSQNTDTETVFRWVDKITVALAAKDGLKGQKLVCPDGESLNFVDTNSGNDYGSWRGLIDAAIDVQQFAEIAVETQPNQPISLYKAVSAAKGLIGVGFGLGNAVVDYEQAESGTVTATIKHPVLWDFEVKISAEDHEDGPAKFSVSYKNEEGRQIEFKDVELTNTSFTQKIFQPMAEQYQRDFEELYRVDHLLEISRVTSPGHDLGRQPLVGLTSSSPDEGAETHYRA